MLYTNIVEQHSFIRFGFTQKNASKNISQRCSKRFV